jgi:hypothetical protein
MQFIVLPKHQVQTQYRRKVGLTQRAPLRGSLRDRATAQWVKLDDLLAVQCLTL